MKAILTDVTRCIGCELCVEKCKEINKLGDDMPWRWQSRDGLSASRWTSVITRPGSHYVRKHCQHCLYPACVAACPVGALKKTPEGPVIYDVSVCIGCRYCMNACPFGIPKYDWNQAAPSIQKCNLCYPRILQEKKPGCVEVCPTKATIFGEREEMIAEANRRIRQNPDKYIHKVWGKEVVGGTSVLYISGIDLSFLGWKKNLGNQPLPRYTWNILTKMPSVFLGIGGLMAGVYWLYERKNKIQTEKAQSTGYKQDQEDDGNQTS
ncbi:MAG: 4Fe-4S dicluster domain-containing protein [Deltaproteobacteria bacterium]|nr:4Fe-4S dicluster domain-containing protein [Deltaproteobacteria bacterium]MBW2308767.1 4Fe-4S dicluster domain-containing protein [Deltaproteobacteria bacterium]